MTTQIATQPQNELLIHLSTDELKQHLSRALEMTVTAISYMAAVVVELERRGEDLSHLRNGLMPYLRSVAERRLAPEAVIAFAGQKMLMRALERVPLERQVEIATSRHVTVERGGALVTIDTRDISHADIKHDELAGDGPQSETQAAPPKPAQRSVAALVSDAEYHDLLARALRENLSLSNTIRQALGLPVTTGGRSPWRRKNA